MIFSLYFQIILSLSLSFLFHLFNFKKHFHSFFTTNNKNHKCPNPNPTYPVSSKSKLLISLPPRPTIHDNMEPLMVCTEGIGFESMQLVDDYDYGCSIIDENNEGDEYYWKNTRVVEEEEEGVNGNNTFPPPLSTLGSNGLPSYILLPVRMNGRLQLNKMKVKRPKTVYADREDGRLRLFLVTDECYIEEDDEVEQEEEEMVEESRYEYEEDDRVREWNNNEKYIKRYHCHQQLVDNIHGSHGNLLMYGVGIV